MPTKYRTDPGLTFGVTENMVTETCCVADCLMPWLMPESFVRLRRNDRETFYCPRGHGQHYTGKTDLQRAKEEAERLRRQVQVARDSEAFYRERAAFERRSAAAYKGQVTRLRNLMAKGICPVAGCRRNFENVRAHMATQHPEWVHEHPEVVAGLQA